MVLLKKSIIPLKNNEKGIDNTQNNILCK